MNSTPAPVVAPIKSLRILVGTVDGGLVLFGFILYSIHTNGDYPPAWVPWALGGLAVISHLLIRRFGFNLKPVPPGTLPDEAMAMARTAFQASTLLRVTLSEPVAIIAIVLSFVILPTSWMTYLIGGLLALVLISVNAWPSAAVISMAQQRLDRDGGQSFLRDALLGVAPGTTPQTIIDG